jgi:hypothetical protein
MRPWQTYAVTLLATAADCVSEVVPMTIGRWLVGAGVFLWLTAVWVPRKGAGE